MSRFNTSTNHPIIPNVQQYMFERQYISIHSEDRNTLKYPNSSEFELELPQDYLNVQGIKLVSSRFPRNIRVFSACQKNITLTFKITKPYNPAEFIWAYDPILEAIFTALYNNITENYIVVIEEGSYTPVQMATELTNKFNYEVTKMLLNSTYLTDAQKSQLLSSGGYSEFIVVYNEVSKKLWFGNRSDEFTLTTSDVVELEQESINCCNKNTLPEYAPWGLPWYLGLSRCDTISIIDPSINSQTRFYYTDVSEGIWLTPNPYLMYSNAYYAVATYPINLLGSTYMYMEIKGLNVLDETEPYNFSTFTMQTNQNNGIVNAAFAKIPIVISGNECEYVDQLDGGVYKIYNPPAERIRKIAIKIRYHNGTLINFENKNYSFTLEFTLFRPQNAKSYTMYTPESIANNF
jgi:hypothetical protein